MKLPEFYIPGFPNDTYTLYNAHIIISNTLHGAHIIIFNSVVA